MGDFNGDGKTDFACMEGWGSAPPMTVYLSTGDGSFAVKTGPSRGIGNSISGASLDIQRCQFLGDFNGDGKIDFACMEGWGSAPPMTVYLSNGDGSFRVKTGPSRGIGTDGASLDIQRCQFMGDFNGDGKTDFACMEGWGSAPPMTVYLSNGNGSFTVKTGPNRGIGNSVSGASLDIQRCRLEGDLTGDGKTDFACMEGWGTAPNMSIYPAL
jgi:hypothetical protein